MLACSSCSWFSGSEPTVESGEQVARVGETFLYSHQVETLAALGKDYADSLRIVNEYIDNWIKRQLILEKADRYLPRDKSELERKVRDYKESLMVHLYESALVQQKLDTNISNQEIAAYFENFKDKFPLEKSIAALIYVKLQRETPKLDSARYWIKNFDYEENYPKLLEYCLQYAEDHMLVDTLWVESSRIANQIPLTIEEFEAKAKFNQYIEVDDSISHYLINISDFRIKGRYAPLNYIREEIIQTILNKRKLELVSATYDNVYKEAEALGKFEILK